jgi:superkiller protein 3
VLCFITCYPNFCLLCRIGNIKQCLAQYEDALKVYEIILERDPTYVPALKGFTCVVIWLSKIVFVFPFYSAKGETHLLQAEASLKEAFHGRVKVSCEAALVPLTKASARRPDLSCVWKLLGDACSMLYRLPSKMIKFVFKSPV